MEKPKILFMGTPQFAVSSLAKLVEGGYPVVGVVTQPDRPRGRGKTLAPSPVKEYALTKGLPLFQYDRVSGEGFLELLAGLSPQMIVLAAFGQLLPGAVLRAAPLGCLNVHPSLLPKYRGAAPINWAIINGEEKTGVTIMLMDEGLDSGDILDQEETAIEPGETYGRLHDRLAEMGACLLIKAVDLRSRGQDRPIPQDHSLASFAPKIQKEDCLINWDDDATRIVNLIRGLSPLPGAFTYIQGRMLKIYQAEPHPGPAAEPPGSLIVHKPHLLVAARHGHVSLKTLQWENRAILPASEFIKGLRIVPGIRAGSGE